MEHLAAVFTFISGPCSLIMIILLIHFLYSIQDHVQKRRKRKPVDRLAKMCGIISLAGYTSYVVSVFILDLWSSACYFPALAIPYSKVVCQMHAFTIVLFMMGKFGMWFFFMALVYVSFRGSFLEYSRRILGAVAVMFSAIMCTIGGLYIFLLYRDFNAMDSIQTPQDCLSFDVSAATQWVIRTGYTFDALWTFTCLLLFYRRLKSLKIMMDMQQASEVEETKAVQRNMEAKRQVNAEANQNQVDADTNGTTNTTNPSGESGHSPESPVSPNTITLNQLATPPLRESDEAPPSDELGDENVDDSNGSGDEPSVVIVYDEHGCHDENDQKNVSDPKNEDHTDNEPHQISRDQPNPNCILPIDPTKMKCGRSHSSNSTSTEQGDYPRNECYIDGVPLDSFGRIRITSLSVPDQEPESRSRKVSISELRKRVHAKREQKKKKQGMVHQFLPVMLKMTILSTWCALSTVVIFGIMGGTHPTLSGVLDSLINGICVYLSFGFTQRIYGILCLPILACKECAEYVNVVKEADQMSRDPNYEQEHSVLG